MSAAFMNYVRKVDPYVPGDQPNFPDMVKLNTNENPYPPAPAVEAALHDLSVDSLRLYPDPVVSKLNTAIADFYGVKPEQVFSGVGSDDVLADVFQFEKADFLSGCHIWILSGMVGTVPDSV